MRALLACGLAACAPIYDGQYEDRREELEEFRVEFLPADADVQFLGSGQRRLFWIDAVPPQNRRVMHSIDPADPNSRLDYAWSDMVNIENLELGEQLVANCTTSARAFSATEPNRILGETNNGSNSCAVSGLAVYFNDNDTLTRWLPMTGAEPVELFTFQEAGIEGTVEVFGVIGDLLVATEFDGDIYTIDLAAPNPQAVWLENEFAQTGTIFISPTEALFETQEEGIRHVRYADKAEQSFDALVADGGYHLNFKHDDIHLPPDDFSLRDFVIHDRHVVYRGNSGIFAYGFETRNVIDLLFEANEGTDPLTYERLTVTAGGTMFVQAGNGFSTDGPVYRVDLAGRLK